MSIFTVILLMPELENMSITVSVESDDHINATNAAVAKVILNARRDGCIIRPEEFTPIAVFAGHHLNLMAPE